MRRLDERAVAVLSTVAAREPVAVRDLLGATDLCESDLHGLLAELVAAEFLIEREVGGERGYALTDRGRAVLSRRTD